MTALPPIAVFTPERVAFREGDVIQVDTFFHLGPRHELGASLGVKVVVFGQYHSIPMMILGRAPYLRFAKLVSPRQYD